MIDLTARILCTLIATSINLYCWNKYRKEKNFNYFALQSFMLGFGFFVWIKLIIELITLYYA